MDPVGAQPLPPPAPFMLGCRECVRLLREVADTVAADTSCLAELHAVARHIVEDHPDQIPAAHTRDCDRCPAYAARNDGDPGQLWAEHRARDLFLPEAVARLL
ncbi:hypothetical protein [Streptomyces sp. T028]|uniref:hypothetical protein n=1 Tax=Streptomyces sp. T028 TaxID=3394379 RepID=UPI003A868C1C